MASSANDLNAIHKTVFGEGVPDLIPGVAILQKDIDFKPTKKLGSNYEQPVRLALPSGFTHAAGDGSAGAFALNDALPGLIKKASVSASQILLRDWLSYEDAVKASNGSKAAYISGTELLFSGLQKSLRRRIEIGLLYGGAGLGKVGTYTAANAGYPGSPATIALTLAEWAPQIWAGSEGTQVDVYTSVPALRGTVTLAGVDTDARILILSAPLVGTVAGDSLFFAGTYGKEMTGLDKMFTAGGNLFNINTSLYSLWKPNVYDAQTHKLYFNTIKSAISQAVGKGLDENIKLYVNPVSWDDLATDILSLRRTDKSEKSKVEVGTENIVFHSQNGLTEVVPHPMVKGGDAFGLCLPNWSRIGSTDVSLGMGGDSSKVFFDLPNNAGLEARIYTNQALFTEMPATSFKIKNLAPGVA